MSTAPALTVGAANPAARYHQNIVALNPEALIARAIEANVPVEALERLLAMRAELKRELAREEFNRALAAFQADIPPITKTKVARIETARGKYTYHYADIADIQRAIAPRMRDSGLSVTFDTTQEADTLTVTCIVHHVDGHSERTAFPVPIDRTARMNDTQKVGSALTYGRRYALCAALGIVTAEDDDDGQGAGQLARNEGEEGKAEPQASPPEPPAARISNAQHRLLEARITEYGLDRERVKAWMVKSSKGKVNHFPELSKAGFEVFLEKLDEWHEVEKAEAERTKAVAEKVAKKKEEEMTELEDLTEAEEAAMTSDVEHEAALIAATTNQASSPKFLRLKEEAGSQQDVFSLYSWWRRNEPAIKLLSGSEYSELKEFCQKRRTLLSGNP